MCLSVMCCCSFGCWYCLCFWVCWIEWLVGLCWLVGVENLDYFDVLNGRGDLLWFLRVGCFFDVFVCVIGFRELEGCCVFLLWK